MPEKIRRVTVVLACRNENPRIGRLIDSLDAVDRTGLDLEAIVADGMSEDGTRAILNAACATRPWLRVIDNPGRIVSTGLNEAIRQARGEFIVRMDGHSTYEPNYVRRSLEVLDATGAANAGGPQRSRAEGYWPRAIDAGFHTAFASGGARFRDDHYTGPADTVPYGCWRRTTLLELGGFDETLVRNQDDELNLRIRLAGGLIWQDASIVSWYTPRATLGGLFRQYLQFGFWRIAVLRKHPGTAAFRHFVPGAALLFGFVCATLAIPLTTRGFSLSVLNVLSILYIMLSLMASLNAARREGWELLPALPITFFIYQFAYATGFCAGLVYWGLCRLGFRTLTLDKAPSLFTGVKR